jgi:valyl-tRNA synthetase
VEKDRKKAAKTAKFEQKKAAKASTPAPAPKTKEKVKPDRGQDEPLPEYIEDTRLGEKKILKSFDHPHFKAYNPKATESAW